MQKFKIKLNRFEQETLLALLVNYDITVFDDEMDRHIISYLGGEVIRRVGKHIRDTPVDSKPWVLKLNTGEAAALNKAIMYVVVHGYFAQSLANKLMFALHSFFANNSRINQNTKFIEA